MVPENPRMRNWSRLQRLLRQQQRLHQHFLAQMQALLQGEVSVPTEQPPPGLKELTPSEVELVRRIARSDDKYSAIWTDLGIKKRTFDTHLNSIYGKLKVRKRSGLVRVAVKWGVE